MSSDADDIEGLRERIRELEKLVYVPGFWRCAKCGFHLVQSNLNASDGSITARDKPGEKCPNDGSPLWRVTEREAHHEMAKRCEELLTKSAPN